MNVIESRRNKNSAQTTKEFLEYEGGYYPNLQNITLESNVSTESNGEGNDSRNLEVTRQIGFNFESPREQTPARLLTPAPPISSKENSSQSNNKTMWIIAVLVIICAIIVVPLFKTDESDSYNQQTVKKVNCSEFMDLQKEFPKLDVKLFKSLRTGVEATLNGKPPEPTVFSLFSTDENVMHDVIAKIIRVTRKCIHQDEDPITLNKHHLNDKIVEMYKEELMKRTIMIVNNVNDASSSDARSLHSFCDTENPLVKKSIIFLTMMVPESPTGKPVEYITDHLNERWKSLADHVREPLIARMLDQTFFLKP